MARPIGRELVGYSGGWRKLRARVVRHEADRLIARFQSCGEHNYVSIFACLTIKANPRSKREQSCWLPRGIVLWRDSVGFDRTGLFWIVKHGMRNTGMSAYGPFYSDQQIWTLATFVKRMNNLSPALLEGIRPKK